MFDTKELDTKLVDEAVLDSINSSFLFLKKRPIKYFSELVDQKILLNLCIEMDTNNFNSLQKNFLFDRAIGIFYAEIKEIAFKLIELLKKTGLNFKNSFDKDFDSINVNSLINFDKNEVKKIVNLLILAMFNCPEKDTFIDRITFFEEFQQQELLKIVERYMQIDDNTRESIRESNINKISTPFRTTINNNDSSNLNLIESEFTLKFMSRIDLLEKDRDNLEKEKINFTLKINELESEIEKNSQEKNNLNKDLKSLEENIKNINNEKQDLNKTILNLQMNLKELEELAKDLKYINDYRIKINEKESEIEYLNEEIKEIKETNEHEVKMFQDKIEILQENNSNNLEMKLKYEKMKDMIKEYQAMKEKIVMYDSMSKEFIKMKNNYLSIVEDKKSLEYLVKELEEKLEENIISYNKIKEDCERIETNHTNDTDKKQNRDRQNSEDNNYYLSIIKEKDNYIKSLESKILILDKNEILKNNSDFINKNIIEVAISNLEEVNNNLKQNEFMLASLESELNKKNEEIDYFKKDNLETKERYEKEFELMASSVYNLGLNYWSMKMEYAQKLSEKPNWLIKERQKYFNGDF